MDKKRLLELAGVPEKEHGDMDLFQDSLKIVFGLDNDTIETLIAMVRRHGDTMQIRDQQVRRRAGGRAVQLLKQAHSASREEGDEHYDDSGEEPEAKDIDPPADSLEPKEEAEESTADIGRLIADLSVATHEEGKKLTDVVKDLEQQYYRDARGKEEQLRSMQ